MVTDKHILIKNLSRAPDLKFTRHFDCVLLAVVVEMLFEVYSKCLHPGKGWYALNEEICGSAFPKYTDNLFFRLFRNEVQKVHFGELSDGNVNPLDPALFGVKYNATFSLRQVLAFVAD